MNWHWKVEITGNWVLQRDRLKARSYATNVEFLRHPGAVQSFAAERQAALEGNEEGYTCRPDVGLEPVEPSMTRRKLGGGSGQNHNTVPTDQTEEQAVRWAIIRNHLPPMLKRKAEGNNKINNRSRFEAVQSISWFMKDPLPPNLRRHNQRRDLMEVGSNSRTPGHFLRESSCGGIGARLKPVSPQPPNLTTLPLPNKHRFYVDSIEGRSAKQGLPLLSRKWWWKTAEN